MERKTYTYDYPRPAVTADTVLMAYPEDPQGPLDRTTSISSCSASSTARTATRAAAP